MKQVKPFKLLAAWMLVLFCLTGVYSSQGAWGGGNGRSAERADVSAAASAAASLGARKVMNFNNSWKYIFQNDPNAKNAVYDESAAGAKDVHLPHAREKYDLYDINAAALARLESINWYRRHFSLDASDKDKRVFVEFNGGGQVNKAYVNGLFVGEARGSFTHFRFDITEYIKFGGFDNVIAVQVDSTFHPEMPPGHEIDFHLFGGLHGEAAMTVVDRAYVDSVFYYNDEVRYGDASAAVNGQIEVVNTYDSPQKFTVTSQLINAKGAVVSSRAQAVRLNSGETKRVDFTHTVLNPILWDIDNPYLYTARSVISTGTFALDDDTRQIGIRSFTAGSPYAAGSAFQLNGADIMPYGANSHMQAPYLGNALTKKMNEKDARTLKYELGMDMVRLSHYQQAPAFMAECDKIGLLVEEEALSWNDLPDFEGQFAHSVLEMVKRDRNHASVVMWSIVGNENPVKNGPSVAARQRMNAAVKALDPSRLTIQEEVTGSDIVADVYGVHDYWAPDVAYNYGGSPALSWIASEWNNNAGQNFVIPGDSELRKLKQMLNYARKMESFAMSEKVMGSLMWNAYGYMTRNGTYDKGKVLDNFRNAGIIGPMRDALDKRFMGYLHQSQRSQDEVGAVLYICSEWKEDSLDVTSVSESGEDDQHPIFPTPASGEAPPPANALLGSIRRTARQRDCIRIRPAVRGRRATTIRSCLRAGR